MTAIYNLLDDDRQVVRSVKGKGTAVMLRNAGECYDFERDASDWEAAPVTKIPAVKANAMFAMGNPVADVEESITAYTGVGLATLRKLASQAGMRTTTGIDPYKQATRDQLIDFLNGGAR